IRIDRKAIGRPGALVKTVLPPSETFGVRDTAATGQGYWACVALASGPRQVVCRARTAARDEAHSQPQCAALGRVACMVPGPWKSHHSDRRQAHQALPLAALDDT